ncbi:hypothetical protein LRS74_12505 [Streptomyces sp. LX-29]|uniref:hypothetical protein n=1 Tax=Streptomyces sp. LX-29 TaxID=2900152 RepID=UPI00240E8FA5|nr:hypothetical protein [Streptomyces sp. LX-29]WFB07778.1 hypothetical protein LRS74_12505 [Streptomyces sp. LX-29]
MLFLVAVLALMGIVLGAAAHTPLPVFLAASAAIAAWLLAFFLRERLTAQHTPDAQKGR